jgi:hypothetical protein
LWSPQESDIRMWGMQSRLVYILGHTCMHVGGSFLVPPGGSIGSHYLLVQLQFQLAHEFLLPCGRLASVASPYLSCLGFFRELCMATPGKLARIVLSPL